MTSTANFFPAAEVRVATDLDHLGKLANWFDATFEPIEGSTGEIWWLTKDGEDPVAVVYLAVGRDDDAFLPVVAHEATHAAMYYMERIGEDKPSHEFMAYTVESFARAIEGQVG